MHSVNPLRPEALLRRCDGDRFAFDTTAELQPVDEALGQERALEALRFGVGMGASGYNLYALGPSGTGKRAALLRYLQQRARHEAVPDDWCYVHGDDDEQPRALRLPAGEGPKLRREVDNLLEGLRTEWHAMQQTTDGDAAAPRRKREAFAQRLGDQLQPLQRRHAGLEPVAQFLERLQAYLLRQFDGHLAGASDVSDVQATWAAILHRCQVNVLLTHGASEGAPVIHEDMPTCANLCGRVEYRVRMGIMEPDFTLIRPGALHRANGGYLLLDAQRLVQNPDAWQALKQALRSGEVPMPCPGRAEQVEVQSLQPQPVPLRLKVVLLGERSLYYQLFENDPDFAELFKVAVDFEDDLPTDRDNLNLYARWIGTVARREQLLALDRHGVARVIEHAARLSEDSERLSLHLASLADLLCESDFWARQRDAQTIGRADVSKAIDMQVRRSDRIQRRTFDEITRGIVQIDTQGARVGQVNGISVVELGGLAFGQPNRISATARLGEGEIVDIERETDLGGSLHSKGVLILSAYLASRYCTDKPLSLAASLVFEQSYAMIEGDSASLAELCALLSALSRIPVRQELGVTGSVNQYGDVQAIGGVNEKIEGFFDLCAARGLSGDQGVVIPRTNVVHLMLREDVVRAAEQGRFAIYAVDHVDQAIELLTGMSAGSADAQGVFPEGSFNRQAGDRLAAFAEIRHEFGKSSGEGGEEGAVADDED